MTKDEALKLALEALKTIDEAMPFPVAKLAQAAIKEALAQPEQEPLEYWNAVEGWVKVDEVREHFDSVGCGTNKCADFWAHYMCINEKAQEDRAYEAKRWIERMRQAAELKPQPPEKVAEHADGTITVRVPLYTTPPQRKPLTDEEIGAILEGVNAYGTRLYTFARAIEAAHGIKGEA